MSKSEKAPPRRIAVLILPSCLLLIILIASVVTNSSQQFSMLAKAFLHGQLNFLSPIGGLGQDPIFWHGKIYWGEGPFPAILLLPFMAAFSLLHLFFYQSYLQWALIGGIFFFAYKLARSLQYSGSDSYTLALGFGLGSVFIGVAWVASSWFFAQVTTTFLLFWVLYEYFSRRNRNWLIIGAICGLVLLTRVTASPIVLFFMLEIWRGRQSNRLESIIRLCLPFAVAVGLIALYNFLRFHSPLNGGFSHQLLYKDSAAARSLGEFSLVHIPTNLYSLLLRAPIPVLRDTASWTLKFPYINNNIYGMSIFITSPYLANLFFYRWVSFDRQARHLLVAFAVSALLVLSYFGIGMLQFGYRYSLDFLPELFLLFMIMYRKKHTNLSTGMRGLLLGSGIFNFLLLLTLVDLK